MPSKPRKPAQKRDQATGKAAPPAKPGKAVAATPPRKSTHPRRPPPDEITFPRRVRITGDGHPHHGKSGAATGETGGPPGLPADMLLIELDSGARCYADPQDLTLLDDPPAKKPPSRRAAAAQVKKKLTGPVPNGGAVGNALDVDRMQNPRAAGPHVEEAAAPAKARKKREPEQMCEATSKRSGEPCRHPAGFRTDHPGSGRCWLHGGRSRSPTGRYSSVRRPRFQELLEEFQEDPDPLNLLDEVMLLRALVAEFIDNWEEQDRMLTRWNLSFEKEFKSDWTSWYREARANILEMQDDLTLEEAAEGMPDPMSYLPGKPMRMADITEVAGLIDRVGSMVDRIHKHARGKTFDMVTIDRLWTAMSSHLTQSMLEVIEDDTLRERLHASVAEKWGTISLAELASRGAEAGEEAL